MNYWMATSNRIRSLREQSGLTQDQLAAEIGYGRSTLASIEVGQDTPGLAFLIAVADYFRVPLDWLLARTPPSGGPLLGQFVERPDELAVLAFWRSLSHEERSVLTRLLRIGGEA